MINSRPRLIRPHKDLASAREELTLAKAETAKLKETLELKNDNPAAR